MENKVPIYIYVCATYVTLGKQPLNLLEPQFTHL